MKFASDATIAILENALEREKQTRDFYSSCLDSAKISGTQVILRSLTADEERHVAIVTALLDEARSGGNASSVDTGCSDSAQTVFSGAFPHKMTADADFTAESTSVGTLLSKALANEKESHDNYAKAAVDSLDADAAEIFEALAAEEQKHYILIDNLVNYLDDPDTWLYKEENQLFNL